MSSKEPNKPQQKPVPVPPQPLSDLPEAVSDEDGRLIKGGPNGHNWQKPLI